VIFSYDAFTRSGETAFGSIEAENKDEASRLIYAQNMIVNKLVPIRSVGGKKVKPEELIIFTRLLGTAVNASVTLTRALEITMEELEPKSPLRMIVISILHQLKVGKSLSESMQLFQHVFSELYVNMVRAGERSGKLGMSLDEALKYLQKRYEMKKKLGSAMLYPSMIMGFAFVVLIFFISVLIPKFQESYSQFGGNLPAFTQGLIDFSNWVKHNLIWLFGSLGLVVYLVFLFIKRTAKGRAIYEQALFAIPVSGDIYKKDIVARFTRTLSVLLHNGITLVESLELTRGVVNNSLIEATINDAIKDLAEGKSFSAALKDNKYLPPILIQMSAMGEESGRLPDLMENLSDFYEKEVDVSVEKITSVITPVMIIFIGLVIGIIVVALFLPMFNMSNLLQ
jgi:type IV pilus assembly protein PilC